MKRGFQIFRIKRFLLRGVIACLVATVLISTSFAKTAGVQEPGLSQEDVRQIEQAAKKMFDAIVGNNVPELLRFIDPDGIRWGADGVKSYVEAENDLSSGKGQLYCRIFGCPKSSVKSVRAYFRSVKPSRVKTEVWYFKEASVGDMKSAKVFYHWPGKPREFDDQFSPLEFRWEQKTGWKCESLFED